MVGDSYVLSFPLSAKTVFTNVSCKKVNWNARLIHPCEIILNKLVKEFEVNFSI